ncbi:MULTISPECIES: pentapeptide repeat-containing protein [unclassified Leifsonia]|uniref:pentapeptide repeat-containing protein n=1 Tax=unclassified Leifsonia TaxID=2663824 RepID=UPI0008A72EC1|nr:MULTISPECIES: pentapeptide repeat-containing protein [unclassified Leifsonia]SEI16623.1 Uncharacterized protein YjbI, contains pentapeptide repeats [Leifsonia sp. CL154]SFM07604.1 Uncharacterized protein YjbI, contains pentapeptide repeats [Leifsonia sp. CL147]
MTMVELRKRWDTAEGRALAAAVSAWLYGRARRPRNLDSIDGRHDLRGLAMHHLQSQRPATIYGTVENARWKDLDLRGASLDHMRWSSVEVGGCLFDGASLDGLRVWESSIEHTSFTRAKLEGALIGAGEKYPRNQWRHVSFQRAKMRDAIIHNADLDDVDFSNADLKGASFRHSRLEGIRFAGPLRDVLFENRDFVTVTSVGHPMRSVDFSDSEFYDVEFRGSHFDSVTFPTSQEHLLIPRFPSAARWVLHRLEGDDSEWSRMLTAMLSGGLVRLSAEDSTGFFIRDDFVRWEGEGFADFVFDLLRSASLAIAGEAP